MLNSSQRIIFTQLNERFKNSSVKKFEEIVNINTEFLAFLKELDLGEGSSIQKTIVSTYIEILTRIDSDPNTFRTSLVKKLEYAFESIDKHFVS